MSSEQAEQKELLQGKSRWLRASFFAVTVVGPMVGNLLTRLRQQQKTANKQSQVLSEKAQSFQDSALQRLDQITQLGRQRTVDQIKTLQSQSHDLQTQVKHLRKSLRRELKQRSKLAKKLRESSLDWNKELLQRSEDLREDLLERSGKLTHDLSERSGKLTQTLVERGGQLTQDLTERGEQLLQQRRKPGRATSIVGFGLGIVSAGAITYLLIRRKTAQLQVMEQNQQIELPQSDRLNGSSYQRPSGEIIQLERDGSPVATLSAVEVETTESQIPANAAFVGNVQTMRYYPLGTELKDAEVVYFASEEDARAQGFSLEA